MADRQRWREKLRSWYPDGSQYWLTRFWFQRSLAFLYLIAFLIAANQYMPLLGEHGLQPVRLFVKQVHFDEAPSLFFLNCSDGVITATICCGLALSVIALLGVADRFGAAISVAVWGLLWLVYLSLVNVGQVFYGFGWETILLETGFLAIFLGSNRSKPPWVVFYLLLWELFRIMFGAGMIKLRGDECWRDLTCLDWHHETQPLPNPVSWYFHHFPKPMLKAGVLFNHFVELIVPWFFFAPCRLRYVAGGFTILFQLVLILSGNLSWLNYVTIVIAIPCFDDRFLRRLTPRSVRNHLPEETRPRAMTQFHLIAVAALTIVVVLLSVRPATNLFSRRQLMNAGFEPLHLVNTYGAFGSVTRERFEIIIEGTDSAMPDDSAIWRAYEFNGKPGDVHRRPCFVSPYHWKLDWQMWFAAMSPYQYHPWILNLVAKLLEDDKPVLSLLTSNPFPDAPPKFIRAELYLYHFTDSRADGAWWRRERVGSYLPPLSLDDPKFRQILEQQGWRKESRRVPRPGSELSSHQRRAFGQCLELSKRERTRTEFQAAVGGEDEFVGGEAFEEFAEESRYDLRSWTMTHPGSYDQEMANSFWTARTNHFSTETPLRLAAFSIRPATRVARGIRTYEPWMSTSISTGLVLSHTSARL